MSKWVKIDPCIAFRLPMLAGCYVVYLDGKLAYIGQTRSIRRRFGSYGIRPSYGGDYFTPWGAVDSIAVKVRFAERLGDQAMREIRLIHRLRPAFNCVGGRQRARKAGTGAKDKSPYSDAYYQRVNSELGA